MFERDGPKGPRASNGELYFTLTHAGRKSEGAGYAFQFMAIGEDTLPAISAAKDAFMTALHAEKALHGDSILEWRTRPEAEVFKVCTIPRFDGDTKADPVYAVRVRARLAFVDAMSSVA